MLLTEFEPLFGRLRATYGEKIFPAEREKAFFKRYSGVPVNVFQDAVEGIIFTMPQPSAIFGLIENTVASWRSSQRSQSSWSQAEQRQNKYPPCGHCLQRGFVTAFTKWWPHYETLFKCHCEAAVEFKCRAMVWNAAVHGAEYTFEKPSSRTDANPPQISREKMRQMLGDLNHDIANNKRSGGA